MHKFTTQYYLKIQVMMEDTFVIDDNNNNKDG